MKKFLCVFLILALVLGISSSLSEIFYWDASSLLGALTTEETIIEEDKHEFATAESSRDVSYMYASLTKLTIVSDVSHTFDGSSFYSLNLTYVDTNYETLYSKIDSKEFELFGKFLEEANSHPCVYMACDGAKYQATSDEIRVFSPGYYAYMKKNECLPYLIERLNDAKSKIQ